MQRFGAMLASIGYDVKTAHVLFQHERGGQDIDDIRGMILRDPNTQLITLPLLQHVYDFSQDIGKEFVPKP